MAPQISLSDDELTTEHKPAVNEKIPMLTEAQSPISENPKKKVHMVEEAKYVVSDKGYIHGKEFMTKKGKLSVLVDVVVTMGGTGASHMGESFEDHEESMSIKSLLEKDKEKKKIKYLEEKVKEVELLDHFLKSQNATLRTRNAELLKEVEELKENVKRWRMYSTYLRPRTRGLKGNLRR